MSLVSGCKELVIDLIKIQASTRRNIKFKKAMYTQCFTKLYILPVIKAIRGSDCSSLALIVVEL